MAVSRFSFSSGYSGREVVERDARLRHHGRVEVDVSTRSMAKNRSPSLGDRICPATVSPVFRLNSRICDGEM